MTTLEKWRNGLFEALALGLGLVAVLYVARGLGASLAHEHIWRAFAGCAGASIYVKATGAGSHVVLAMSFFIVFATLLLLNGTGLVSLSLVFMAWFSFITALVLSLLYAIRKHYKKRPA